MAKVSETRIWLGCYGIRTHCSGYWDSRNWVAVEIWLESETKKSICECCELFWDIKGLGSKYTQQSESENKKIGDWYQHYVCGLPGSVIKTLTCEFFSHGKLGGGGLCISTVLFQSRQGLAHSYLKLNTNKHHEIILQQLFFAKQRHRRSDERRKRPSYRQITLPPHAARETTSSIPSELRFATAYSHLHRSRALRS
jgi:hypothetical protein